MEQEGKSALACDFCGRVSVDHEGWRQLFTRSMTSHDDEKAYMACPKCHKKLIDENVGAVIDPEAAFDAIRDSLEDNDPAKDYIGVTLRDFLRSNLYLRTHGIYFTDRYGIQMKDYLGDMGARVLRIEKPDGKGCRRVMLDTEQ